MTLPESGAAAPSPLARTPMKIGPLWQCGDVYVNDTIKLLDLENPPNFGATFVAVSVVLAEF